MITVVDAAACVARLGPATALVDRGSRKRTARTGVEPAVGSAHPIDALHRVAVGIVAQGAGDGSAGVATGAVRLDRGRPPRVRTRHAGGHPPALGRVLTAPPPSPRAPP